MADDPKPKGKTGSAKGPRQVHPYIRVLVIDVKGKKRWEVRPNPAFKTDVTKLE